MCGDPLVNHVIYRISDHVDEILVVVSSGVQKDIYSDIAGDQAKLIVDLYDNGLPLVGYFTGLSETKDDCPLLTGYDMPFISHKVIQYLFNAGEGRNGIVFGWPNGWVEPLIAVCKIKPSLDLALDFYNSGNLKLHLIMLNREDVDMVTIETFILMDSELFRSTTSIPRSTIYSRRDLETGSCVEIKEYLGS